MRHEFGIDASKFRYGLPQETLKDIELYREDGSEFIFKSINDAGVFNAN